MGGAAYQVEVHGSVGGNLVVGDHNLIVNATNGSSVTVLQEAQRRKPVRRTHVRVLPRRSEAVLGRSRELATISAAVVAQSTIQVYGPPGIGKSTLLRQAAHDVAGEADGIVFLSAAGRSAADVPQDIFEAVYDSSGYRPGPAELAHLMSGVRACVIADDLVATADEVGAILDALPDTSFVFAAPDRELWDGQALELAGLSEADALALVRREFGRDLMPAEAAAVAAEWRSAGGSPLRLLRTAAALEHAPTTAPEQDVLALLGFVAPAAATVPAVAAMAHTHHVDHVAAATERLARAGLIERVGDAFRLADDLIVAVDARRYRRTAADLALALVGFLAAPATAAELAELVVAVAEAAIRSGQPTSAVALARHAAPLAARSLRFGAWRDVLSVGLAAAKDAGDRAAEAYFTHERGIRLLCLGQAATAAAVLGTAIGLWQAVGNVHGAAAASAAQSLASGSATASSAATGSAGSAGTQGGPVGQHPMPHPAPAPPQPVPSQIPIGQSAASRRAVRRAVGRARVGRARVAHPGATPSAFPTGLVVTLAAVVVVLGVLAAILVPRLTAHHTAATGPSAGPAASGQPSVAPSASPSLEASASPSLLVPPEPYAFAPATGFGTDPSAVLDGDPSTLWSSVAFTTNTSDDAWIAIDMGMVGPRSQVTVTPAPRLTGFPSQFRIEYSVDGTTWLTVPGQEWGAGDPYPATGDGPQALTFPEPVQARYLRLFATVIPRAATPNIRAVASGYRLVIADMSVA